MHEEAHVKHLIDSADWSLEEISALWDLSRRLKSGEQVAGIERCLERKSVILAFSERTTRTRLTFHSGIVEMGGVPLVVEPEDIHKKTVEHLTDFALAMAVASSAICMRLSPSEILPQGSGEKTLRAIASITEQYNVPVISVRHDRCHPCQGLYEALTLQDALGRRNLKGTRIVYAWVKGSEPAPWSPTQDSLMLATRLGMEVTLCNPPGYELDETVLAICRQNAEKSGGRFVETSDFESAIDKQEIVYARHWATKEQQSLGGYYNRYLDEDCFARANPGAFFIHPMPLKRNDEVAEGVADGDRSLLRPLVENKFYLQKAVLAMTTGFVKPGNQA